MSEQVRMVCPRCGAEMNHHADKIDYGVDGDWEGLGGALEDVYACSKCSTVELRRREF